MYKYYILIFVSIFLSFGEIYSEKVNDSVLACKEKSLDENDYVSPSYSMYNETLNPDSVKRDSAGRLTYFETHVAIQADGYMGIWLKDTANYSDTRYYLYVGRDSNQYTDLKYQSATVQHVHTPDILSSTQFTKFYIKVVDGKLEFGKEGDSSPLISHYDARFLTVSHFMFRYNGHHEAKVRYDCPAKESS